jgi:type I restriction enzyme S subunit
MEQFSLSAHIDPNKVFLVNYSELEERFDSAFYKPEYSNLISKRKKWSRCRDISYSIQHPPEYERIYSEKGTQLIRSQNVRPWGLSLDENPVFFSNDFLAKKKVVYPSIGDVLIVRSGVNAGDVATIDVDITNAIIGADNLLLKPKVGRIVPKFIQVYFNTYIGRTFLNRYLTGATNVHISPYYLSKVRIPELSIENQKICVRTYEDGLIAKQQKEFEAKSLLESIDAYLLGELGITLPEQDNSFQNRIFTTKFSDVVGDRLDSIYFKTKHYKIEGGIFQNKKLKQLASILKGQSITKDKVIEGEYPVIAGGQSSPYNHNEFNYERNIITISASGAYSGFVWYHDYPIFASDCCVIKSKNELAASTMFLTEILKLKQKEIYFLQQGAGQPHVYASDLADLQIPIPEPDKQAEILKHIQNIRSQAKTLQQEAARVLEEAKREVEKMILGE